MTQPKPDPVLIRPMELRDVEAVTAIDQQSFSLPWPKNAFTFELLENPTAHLWVAEILEGDATPQVIGMIAIWFILDEAHISTLAIHPNFRGRGLAIRLLQQALQFARARGMKSATLEVRASNQIAQSLYKKLGFKVVGRRSKYYRDNNEDAILMTLEDLNTLPHNQVRPAQEDISNAPDHNPDFQAERLPGLQ